eukprot:scaffold97437_cov67-Phaeocystis_antarctica.AAC.3
MQDPADCGGEHHRDNDCGAAAHVLHDGNAGARKPSNDDRPAQKGATGDTRCRRGHHKPNHLAAVKGEQQSEADRHRFLDRGRRQLK